jgi:hypothetical protein
MEGIRKEEIVVIKLSRKESTVAEDSSMLHKLSYMERITRYIAMYHHYGVVVLVIATLYSVWST